MQKKQTKIKQNKQKCKCNKHAKTNAKKKHAEKMQLLELCIFLLFLGGASGLQKLKKLQKLEEHAKNMRKKCKKNDKHANSGTVHVLQKNTFLEVAWFLACICCRGFWGCTFWVHCFCICFAFESSFRPRISCFLLHNCNKSAAKCCVNMIFLGIYIRYTQSSAQITNHIQNAHASHEAAAFTLGGSAEAWHYTSSNDTGNFSQECQE